MLVLDHPPQDDYYIARQIYGEVSRKQSVKAKKNHVDGEFSRRIGLSYGLDRGVLVFIVFLWMISEEIQHRG